MNCLLTIRYMRIAENVGYAATDTCNYNYLRLIWLQNVRGVKLQNETSTALVDTFQSC